MPAGAQGARQRALHPSLAPVRWVGQSPGSAQESANAAASFSYRTSSRPVAYYQCIGNSVLRYTLYCLRAKVRLASFALRVLQLAPPLGDYLLDHTRASKVQ